MRKKVKGVYTIEAAILIPLTLFIICSGIVLGINLYTEVRDEAASYEKVMEIDEVESVHKIRTMGTIWEELNDNGV